MARLGVGTTLIGISSVATGVLSVLSILAKLLPNLETVKLLEEALNVYGSHVRQPLAELLSPWISMPYLSDVLVLWISVFIAVNAYIFQREKHFAWGHVRKNYCYLCSQGTWSQAVCTAPKWVLAFIAAPIAFAYFLMLGLTGERRIFQSAYLTVEPNQVAKYLLICMAGVAAIVLAWQFSPTSFTLSSLHP